MPSLQRFVHMDPCEVAFDKPLLYEAGKLQHVLSHVLFMRMIMMSMIVCVMIMMMSVTIMVMIDADVCCDPSCD